MASVMGICGGLLRPKSGNVEKVLVFIEFVEGSKKQDSTRTNNPPGSGRKSEIFDVKCFVSISRIVLPTCGREHIFRKIMKRVVRKRKMEPEDLRWQV